MKACVYLCACSPPDNGSSLPSACRFSKDSWVRFRSRSGSEVGRRCRWPLVHRTTIEQLPNKSESRWVVWRAWHTSLPHTLSFCLLSTLLCLPVFFSLLALSQRPTATQKATPGLHLPTGHEQHCHLETPLLHLWYFRRWGHFSVSAPDPNMSSFVLLSSYFEMFQWWDKVWPIISLFICVSSVRVRLQIKSRCCG